MRFVTAVSFRIRGLSPRVILGAIFVFPPVFAPMAVIWKDSLLALAPSPDYRYVHWMVVCG